MTLESGHPIVFPCERLPEQPAAARLLGLYPQIQPGLLLQRVKILGGRLAGVQWRTFAQIAVEFTGPPGTPLHLTTRQDIEIHDLPADRIPLVQQRLADAALTGLGACGDTLRNVTVCPCSGVRSGAADLFPLAWQIRRELEAAAFIFTLPRKFKISLSACEQACGQPWINDLGLVAARRNGHWGFRVIAGGSLGPRPATGMELFDWLPADDVLPLVHAAVRVFNEHGDREHRSTARLRHVRQRMGDGPFAALLTDALAAAKAGQGRPRVELPVVASGLDAAVTLNFANGDVTPAQAEALADLADRIDLAVRIDTHQRVVVFGRDESQLRRMIESTPVLAAAAQPGPSIAACPGNRWCKHGLTDTGGMADRIRRELAGRLPAGATVRISGCPNNCAHSAVADVGLVGMRAQGQAAYQLFFGGGMGRTDRLATPAGPKVSPDQAIAQIAERTAPAQSQ